MGIALMTFAFLMTSLSMRGVDCEKRSEAHSRTLNFHTMQLTITTDENTSIRIAFYKGAVADLTGGVKLIKPPIHSYRTNQSDSKLQVTWDNFIHLDIQHKYGLHNDTHYYRFFWKSLDPSVNHLENAFAMESAHWYGAAEVQRQEWPIEKWSREMEAFVTGDSFVDQYGGVQERYWLSSRGIALFVDKSVPLFVGMNSSGDGRLRFFAKYQKPYINVLNRLVFLEYTVCQSTDVVATHQSVVGVLFPKPQGIPDKRMFTHPVWSTWAVYKKNISQVSVLQFADQILKHGFNNSQLEIDDDWTPSYGIWDFDRSKFPEPKEMVNELRRKGFRVTVWIHHFITPFNRAFWSALWDGLLISLKGFPAIGYWWNGIASSLDVTNPSTSVWFLGVLQHLQDTYGISSFKFDAGETNWLPPYGETMEPMENPNTYTSLYAELAFKSDPKIRHQEVRVGANTQHLPLFVRMMDKDSNWGYKNGLKTLIPHALTFGILGYPFVLPDMIGGNAYSGYITGTVYPERELFIRWLQASVFMPSIQFSIPPWIYDDEVVNITKRLTSLHARFSGVFISLAHDSVKTGAPINRPLWWICPADENCLTIDSEYLVGSHILVAPVLDAGARSRDIYLPPGNWMDMLHGGTLEGGQWFKDYKADLDELPYFIKQDN